MDVAIMTPCLRQMVLNPESLVNRPLVGLVPGYASPRFELVLELCSVLVRITIEGERVFSVIVTTLL